MEGQNTALLRGNCLIVQRGLWAPSLGAGVPTTVTGPGVGCTRSAPSVCLMEWCWAYGHPDLYRGRKQVSHVGVNHVCTKEPSRNPDAEAQWPSGPGGAVHTSHDTLEK